MKLKASLIKKKTSYYNIIYMTFDLDFDDEDLKKFKF